jgi:hypothetical protein
MDLRKIDALIAQHVFDMPKPADKDEALKALEMAKSADPSMNFAARLEDAMRRIYPSYPAFSEDISAAWDVVEKLKEGEAASANIDIQTDVVVVIGWYGSRADEFFRGEARADTAPLAICLAALKAKGVEIPE